MDDAMRWCAVLRRRSLHHGDRLRPVVRSSAKGSNSESHRREGGGDDFLSIVNLFTVLGCLCPPLHLLLERVELSSGRWPVILQLMDGAMRWCVVLRRQSESLHHGDRPRPVVAVVSQSQQQ